MAMNYNDGKWHGWNGGECPVHLKTWVEVQDVSRNTGEADCFDWYHNVHDGPFNIIAFRVIKEHKEPREWWALWSPGGLCVGNFAENTANLKNDDHYNGDGEVIHIREVLE